MENIKNKKLYFSIQELKNKYTLSSVNDLLSESKVPTTHRVKVINSEWFTYEELDTRVKKILPSLDESKTKTFLIEPYVLKENEECLNYYER